MSWKYVQNLKGNYTARWVYDDIIDFGYRHEARTNEDKLPKKLRRGW